MGCRFFTGSALDAGWFTRMVDVLRIGVGFRLVLERKDVETWPGSKPRTTLCWLISVEVLASEPIGGLVASLPRVVATVELDDSGMRRTVVGGEVGRGVVSWTGFCGAS